MFYLLYLPLDENTQYQYGNWFIFESLEGGLDPPDAHAPVEDATDGGCAQKREGRVQSDSREREREREREYN